MFGWSQQSPEIGDSSFHAIYYMLKILIFNKFCTFISSLESNENCIHRYESDYTPEMMEQDIVDLIKDCVKNKEKDINENSERIQSDTFKNAPKWTYRNRP